MWWLVMTLVIVFRSLMCPTNVEGTQRSLLNLQSSLQSWSCYVYSGVDVQKQTFAEKKKMATDNVIPQSSGYKTTSLLPFEDLDELHFYRWLRTNWSLSITCSVVYVIVIFGVREFMKRRPPFELRIPLILWNSGLAIFSIFGAYRMNQELLWVLSKHGLEHSLCKATFCQAPFGLWVVLFAVSKIAELGDTVFIVLRKRPLLFLHWFHHILTLIYVWVTYVERVASGRWFITMNYNVHALMYSYYALRAMNFRIPKKISITLTSLQTMQMVAGLKVNIAVFLLKSRGTPCSQSYGNVCLALAMYFCYFILFSLYFYNTYIAKKSKTSPEKTQHHSKNGIQNGKVNWFSNGRTKKYI